MPKISANCEHGELLDFCPICSINTVLAERQIGLGSDGKQGWRAWLAEFEEDVWPMFQEFGFDKKTAVILFQLNKLTNYVRALLEEDEDE